MPSLCSHISNLLKKPDLFCQTAFVRYNGEADYSTATGGFVSLAVIIIFVTLFFSMGLKTVKREIIKSTTETQSEIDPSPHTFKIGPGHDLMFGIWITEVPLEATPRLFDFALMQEHWGVGQTLLNTTDIGLEQCTPEHFHFN